MTCAVCAEIEQDPDAMNTVLAQRAGTSEASIRRHRIAKHNAEPSERADEFFGVPDAIITSRGRSIRTSDGSWEKVTYRPQDLALHQATESLWSDFEAALANYTPATPTAPITPTTPTTEIVLAADLQTGKADYLGGTAELTVRVLDAIEGTKRRLQTLRPRQVVLADLGDITEGIWNTTSQRATNDRDLTAQIRIARRLMMEAIKAFAPLCNRLTYVSVPSNHCQVRVAAGGKGLESTVDNDLGLEISHQLEDVFEGREGFGNLEFVRPESLHEAVTVTTDEGTRVGFVHGHQAKSQDRMGEWWKGQSHGRMDGLHEADILCHGHHHNMRLSQSGDARWLVGAPTIDSGSSWFTSRTGESSTPGMLVFGVKDGSWTNLEIV